MGKRRIGWALWLLAAAALCFFENDTGTKAVLAASVLAPLVSAGCAWGASRRVRAEIAVPEACREGDRVGAVCRVTGTRLSAGCCAVCEVAVRNRMTGEERRVTVRDTGRAAQVAIGTAHCGAVEATLDRVRMSDWFGLWAFPAAARAQARTVVHPALFPVQVTVRDVPEAFHGASDAARNGRGGEETMGVRPYVPGDPVRRIHWKLTGKLDRTMLRETGVPMRTPLLLAMAHGVPGDVQPGDAHACVKAMLSVARALVAQGVPCRGAAGVSEDTFRVLPLDTEADVRALEDALLDLPFGKGAGVGELIARCAPDLLPGQTVLFSPTPLVDAVSLYRGTPVTLVLPGQGTAMPGGTEIAVRVLNEGTPELEIG